MQITYEGEPIGVNRKPGDVGFDIKAYEDTVVMPWSRVIVPTANKIALPYSIEEQIRPRSGYSAKGIEGLLLDFVERKQWEDEEGRWHVENVYVKHDDRPVRMEADALLGTVDPDYPDFVGMIVKSEDPHAFLITKGTRLAQAVFNQVVIPELVPGTVGKNNNRDGGFGSSNEIKN